MWRDSRSRSLQPEACFAEGNNGSRTYDSGFPRLMQALWQVISCHGVQPWSEIKKTSGGGIRPDGTASVAAEQRQLGNWALPR